VILGDFLQSKQLDSKQQLENIFNKEIPSVSSTFIFETNDRIQVPVNSLAEKVSKPTALHTLLSHIQCTETLEQAFQKQASLKQEERIITKDGVLLGPNWIKIDAKDQTSQSDGVLFRQKEIEETKEIIASAENPLEQHQEKLEIGQEQYKQLEEQQALFQSTINQLRK